jgi:hypothetical protein
MSRESLVVKDKTVMVSKKNSVQFTFIFKKDQSRSFNWISPFKVALVMNPEKRRSGVFMTIEMAKRLHFSMSLRKKTDQ